MMNIGNGMKVNVNVNSTIEAKGTKAKLAIGHKVNTQAEKAAEISLSDKAKQQNIDKIGQEAIQAIKNYNADILFFSSMGLSEDGYFTDSNKEENDITKEMMKYATKKVALIDSSKIGKKYVYNLCHLTDVDEVICEEELPDYIKKCFWEKSK